MAVSADRPHSISNPLPDFLVIGAMKAGTTTLYHDLRSQRGIFLPDKESNALLATDPETAFARLFETAGIDASKGEVCPDYTKPGSGDAAVEMATKLYRNRPAPKLIYLVREPIARLRSHHHFISTQHGAANPGGMTPDLVASLRDFPELIETSRYASRLQPWLDAFGREAVCVVQFEDYVADRVGTLQIVAEFLGLSEFDSEAIQAETIHNAGESRPVATPFWRKVMGNGIYRRFIRPWLPLELRDRIRARLLPKAPPKPEPPSAETLRELRETLRPEMESLAELIGAEHPLWNEEDAPRK